MIFPFSFDEKMDAENFIPLPANMLAYTSVINFLTDDSMGLVLYGETGTGKTHLAHVAANYFGVPVLKANDVTLESLAINPLIVEDIDLSSKEAQEHLFHAFNHIKTVGGKFLLTTKTPTAKLEDMLPDLRSRLLTLPQIEIQTLDDAQLEILLVKFASDYQLQLEPNVASYILNRVDRNMRNLQNIMQKLNEASLQQKRKVTIPLVKELLESA